MPADVTHLATSEVVALIAATASVIAALISASVSYLSSRRVASDQKAIEQVRIDAQRDLAQVTSQLTALAADRNARRAYEYDALKKLYTVAEPLIFQLNELAAESIDRISDLAKRARNDQFGPDGCMTDAWRYYRPSTFYTLLAPGAAFLLLRDHVTFLDLSLDPLFAFEYRLAFAACDAWSADKPLARQAPRLDYKPDIDQKWQGILPYERERPLRALLVGSGDAARVMSYPEFEDEYNKTDSELLERLSIFIDLFETFSPSSNSVLWRILVSQYFCYKALNLGRKYFPSSNGDIPPDRTTRIAAILAEVAQSADFDNLAWTERGSPSQESEATRAVVVGKRYLAHTITSDSAFHKCADCLRCEGDGSNLQAAHGI